MWVGVPFGCGWGFLLGLFVLCLGLYFGCCCGLFVVCGVVLSYYALYFAMCLVCVFVVALLCFGVVVFWCVAVWALNLFGLCWSWSLGRLV